MTMEGTVGTGSPEAVDIANRQNRRGLPGELGRGKSHYEPGRALHANA